MGDKTKGRHPRIGVPRGLLRHLSFQFLMDGPMSGSEIVDRIEEFTDWRPSPGSIYPLLSHMEEVGLIRAHEDDESTLKRFKLTDKGKQHFEEFLAHGDHMRSRNRNIRKLYWRLHTGMTGDLYESLGALLDTVEETYAKHKNDLEASEKLKVALDKAVIQIREIDS